MRIVYEIWLELASRFAASMNFNYEASFTAIAATFELSVHISMTLGRLCAL